MHGCVGGNDLRISFGREAGILAHSRSLSLVQAFCVYRGKICAEDGFRFFFIAAVFQRNRVKTS